ncbi:hypothetical protein C8Q76DRAFT_637319 [Earliella scabrosa]|nr:hypothetical protein C8Q76DRAFT_637319 [Earliella scabrosa]
MNVSVFAILAALAGVHGQSSPSSAPLPTSTTGISPCILTCVAQAGSATGCSLADVSCVCTNQPFQQQIINCLQTSCSPSDLQAVQVIQQQLCGTGSLFFLVYHVFESPEWDVST